jgi:hypothetical protein
MSPRCQALLVGIDYKCVLPRKHWLPGIVAVLDFKNCLHRECDLKDNNVKMMSDKDQPLKPETILESLQKLIQGAKTEDQLCFYFSGHGLHHPWFTSMFCGFDKGKPKRRKIGAPMKKLKPALISFLIDTPQLPNYHRDLNPI